MWSGIAAQPADHFYITIPALPDGEAMISDYYQHAPQMVEAIEAQQLSEQEWPRVYAMVQQAVTLIEAGHNQEALELYSAEYLRLKAEYVELAVV
jgi:hypothetical protein